MVLGTDRFHLNHPKRRKAILTADKYTAGYICVSQNIADDLIKAGISNTKINIIRNGVDTSMFYPKDEIPGEHYILWIGNLVSIKAPEIALAAFAEITTERPHLPRQRRCRPRIVSGAGLGDTQKLLFVGDGPMRKTLEETALKLGIQDKVVFYGRVAHAEIPAMLNRADCLILSSRSEGMPNAIAEALACGTPVVATDVGACCEMLENQPCTAIVPPNNPEEMSAAIKSVLSEAAQTQKRPAFKRTWADMAEEIMDLMQGGKKR
jgi:glycosyltransferase involved in cell wall biosynthesis